MDITVDALARELYWRGTRVPCALGRSGLVHDKQEGDGGTPAGRLALRRVFFRPDRLASPASRLSVHAIDPDLGWCDDQAHADYNRPVRLPHPARCERMWRDDGLYDVVVELGWNDDPVVPGMGSAIFLHVADPDFAPTEGCVALRLDDLLTLLAACRPGDCLVIA